MCSLVFAFCLVGCYSRWDLSLSDNDSVLFGTCNQVQPSIYISSVFPQSGFRLHSCFAEDFPPNRSGCLPHLIVEWSVQQFKNTNGFVSNVWWILSFGTQITSLREQKMSWKRTILRYGCLQYYRNVQKTQFHRSASLLNLHLIDIWRQIQTWYLLLKRLHCLLLFLTVMI